METADIAAKDNSGELMKSCYRDDVRVLDLSRMLWSRLRTHGSPPTGRFGHTLVLSEDDAVMFGGWSGVQKEAPQVAFALKEKTQAPGDAQAVPEEAEESCDYCKTLRTSDMQWVKNKYVGVAACHRYGHSATAIGPHLIIIGGWDGGKPLKDVVVLRDASVSESQDEGAFLEAADEEIDAEGFRAFDDEL